MKPPACERSPWGRRGAELGWPFILSLDGQCPQAAGSPGGKEGGSSEPRADGRRARGFGPGQLLHNRAGLQAGASGPSPACLPSSDSLRPHQLPPCFPRQGSGFQERLLLSRWAGCSPPPLPLPRIPFSSGIPSHRLSCLPFALQRASLLSAALPA